MNKFFLISISLLIVIADDLSYNQKMYWFEHQLVDHYDKLNKNVFHQRYWVVEENFIPETGVVLFQICGEYTCPGIMEERLFIIQLAKEFNALIIVLEHRYYGKSMPFGSESLKDENLRYLSTRQALDDLAYFQRFMVLNKKHGIRSQNPWIAIGGSYPGALAAWYRYQYPHLVIGALASSAVVESITDFKMFDTQIYVSALKSGPQCAKYIQDMNKYAEQQILNQATKEEFKRSFGAEKLTDLEFLFFFADAQLLIIQYGGRSELCMQLEGKSITEQIDYFRSVIEVGSFMEYGSFYLKNDEYDENNLSPSRQWMYQCCSELGWWQTSPLENSVRSSLIDLQFYRDFCNSIFGGIQANIFPDDQLANARFGGKNLNVDNLIMTNGNEDPWKWSSVLVNQGSILAYEVNCDNSGHCVELYTPKEEDCEQLKQVRQDIIAQFRKWIYDYYTLIQ
ncbi:unnamed protein product [Paramecium primaurelia]|uniref:Serine carboxypeptidase S28 family protein n=1 Tax=Paramecium primaurelia TaxID=5886 RepID=A0A8S1NK77_PARPR|nr:unnamed protein product [Paramecium primaurelia]